MPLSFLSPSPLLQPPLFLGLAPWALWPLAEAHCPGSPAGPAQPCRLHQPSSSQLPKGAPFSRPPGSLCGQASVTHTRARTHACTCALCRRPCSSPSAPGLGGVRVGAGRETGPRGAEGGGWMPSSHSPVGLGTEPGGACLPQGHPSQLHRATFLLSLTSRGFPASRFPLPLPCLPQQAGLGWPKVGAAWHPSPHRPRPRALSAPGAQKQLRAAASPGFFCRIKKATRFRVSLPQAKVQPNCPCSLPTPQGEA